MKIKSTLKEAPMLKVLFIVFMFLFSADSINGEEIGSVDTALKLLGPNHKIIIEAFDDPDIVGVTCHLSRAKAGGLSGGLGIAEDKADAAIACRQIGPIKLPDKIENGDNVFTKKTSILFKTLKVKRFLDKKRNVLVYLVYSDKIIDGSPKNSISTVPILNWK